MSIHGEVESGSSGYTNGSGRSDVLHDRLGKGHGEVSVG